MNTRQHIQKKHPSQSTYTPIQNLYQTRAFEIQQQPSHSSSGQENVDLDADHEQSQYKLYNLPYIPVNAPGTEPPPPIQTQLNSGEPTNYYQQGSADVPWYNRPTYPNIPVNAPGTEPPPPIQTKLTIGEPGDKYEQEADQVASQVVQQINSPVPVQSAQGQTVQREEVPEEEEQVQAKSISDTIQREEVPEEEEQVQAKSISNTIQREELPEEEPLQGKSLKGEIAATPNLETSIQGARGSGQPLDENIRQPMEKAFGGVDFSGVKVHTDGQSDQLNRSIQARAFTTGEDVFFRQGEYNPGSRGGQELIAHELTHVVQQNSGAVQRKVKTGTPASRTLNFITMKRKHIQMGGNDKYGHWWTEMGGESYGWWPKYHVTGIRQTLFGVEGELNGMTSFLGSATKDPHHGDIAPDVFHPIYKGTKTNSAIKADIRSFASSYSGEWRWTFGFGQNCHTFQESLMKSVGIEQP